MQIGMKCLSVSFLVSSFVIPVHLATLVCFDHENHEVGIVNFVQDAVIPNMYPVGIVHTSEFFRAGRPGILHRGHSALSCVVPLCQGLKVSSSAYRVKDVIYHISQVQSRGSGH
jgi:hypothetical protein